VQAAWAEFRRDLGAALGAWAKAPVLPLLASALWLAWSIPDEITRSEWVVALSFVWIVFAGWPGTERIWYLRAFRGKAIVPREVASFSVRFIGPYIGLGLIAVLIGIPLFGLALLATSGDPSWLGPLVYVPLDVLFTFMTPALAFTTRRPGEAFSIGLNMLKDEWPHCAGYALVPPLAALLVVQTLPASALGTGARLALGLGTTLLNLWFKGATAAFYLRRHPEVGDDGSLSPAEELRPVESGAEDF